MAGVVSPIYIVSVRFLVGPLQWESMNCSRYVSTISINQEVQTLSPTFTIMFSEDFRKMFGAGDFGPINGSEKFSIGIGYGSTTVSMFDDAPISTFSRTATQNGIELVVNGRGALSALIDEAPELDLVYVPTWDKSESADGVWVSAACGIQRVEPVPPGVDPNQDVSEYEILEDEWTVHKILNDIIKLQVGGLELVINMPDAEYRETFRVNRSQTWLSAIQQLCAVWEPQITISDGTVYILDLDIGLPASSNITYGSSSCVVIDGNSTKNNIVNRALIKGGYDESVAEPPTKTVWTPRIDLIQEFMGENLSTFAKEETLGDYPTPSAGGYFSGFTGSRIKHGYFQPMFGDKVHVYTRTVNYYNDQIMKIVLEMNYFKASGNFGPDQQVCTKVYKKRRQEYVIAGYFTKEVVPRYVPIGDVFIESGFSGMHNTGPDAADPYGQPILPIYFGGYSYIKVIDQEEMLDSATGNTFSTSTSRTFGILPKSDVLQAANPSEPVAGTYYLIGGAPVVDPQKLYEHYRLGGKSLSYRIITEKVVTTDMKSSTMALKQTQEFDYTRMTSDYSMPIITSTSEVIPINSSGIFTPNKKSIYQFEKYYELTEYEMTLLAAALGVGEVGWRPLLTYYDPSIINEGQSDQLWAKIRAKSGRMEQEITIRPTIGNPLLSVGKSLVLESATYKQMNYTKWEISGYTQLFEDTAIEGGSFLIAAVRHNFSRSEGFKTEILLRRLFQ